MSGRTLGEDRTVVQPVGEGPLESVMTNVEKGNGSSRERTGRRSEMASVDGERDSRERTGRSTMTITGEGTASTMSRAGEGTTSTKDR